MEFKIITSSPRYPKSNGLAERAVGICKNILRKCSDSDNDFQKALLEYRNTPLAGLNVSPAELMFSRLVRSVLPMSGKHMSCTPVCTIQK